MGVIRPTERVLFQDLYNQIYQSIYAYREGGFNSIAVQENIWVQKREMPCLNAQDGMLPFFIYDRRGTCLAFFPERDERGICWLGGIAAMPELKRHDGPKEYKEAILSIPARNFLLRPNSAEAKKLMKLVLDDTMPSKITASLVRSLVEAGSPLRDLGRFNPQPTP